MGLFVTKKDNLKIEVCYMFENDDICILSDSDIDNIGKKDIMLGWDIPFNTLRLKAEEKKKEDIRKTNIEIRKPSFNDVSDLVAPLKNIVPGSNFSPSDIIRFNNERLIILFDNGFAEDKDGKKYDLNKDLLSKLSPNLGVAIAFKMNDFF